MLDFRRPSAARNYLAGSQQRRLLIWALLIGLPIIAVMRFGEFLARPPRAGQVAEAIDARLPDRTPQSNLPDAFTSHPTIEGAQPDTTGSYFVGVKPAYLETVRDDTPSRPADLDACLNLLDVLNRTPEEELKAASQGRVSYVQLFRQPDTYRARLVDMAGTVRRVERMPLARNAFGLTHYYQLWIQPDGGVNNPVVAYCLTLSDDFPSGDKLREPIDLTGFFFKRVAYSAKGGPMTAPMLLAKTVQWTGADPSRQDLADWNRKALGWVIAAAFFGLLGLVAVTALVSRWTSRLASPPPADFPPSVLEALRGQSHVRVEEHLERLSRDQP